MSMDDNFLVCADVVALSRVPKQIAFFLSCPCNSRSAACMRKHSIADTNGQWQVLKELNVLGRYHSMNELSDASRAAKRALNFALAYAIAAEGFNAAKSQPAFKDTAVF